MPFSKTGVSPIKISLCLFTINYQMFNILLTPKNKVLPVYNTVAKHVWKFCEIMENVYDITVIKMYKEGQIQTDSNKKLS